MLIGVLFIIWGVFIFGYGIYMTVKNSPGSDGIGWFLAFANIIGGVMFSISGFMLFNIPTTPSVALLGGFKKLFS